MVWGRLVGGGVVREGVAKMVIRRVSLSRQELEGWHSSGDVQPKAPLHGPQPVDGLVAAGGRGGELTHVVTGVLLGDVQS